MESIDRSLPGVALAAVMLTSALIPVSASANATGMFDALDEDRNDRLVRQELSSHPALVERFSRADVDRDGGLSRAEFERLLSLPGAVPTLE